MRFVVVGAGAVGGVVGARLAQAGFAVQLVARGAHGRAIANDGLVVEDPVRREVLRLPVVDDPSDVVYHVDDVVLCAVMSQHTAEALQSVRAAAGPEIPVVCMQNGVDNERLALRLFHHVHTAVVVVPALRLQAGVVQSNAWPASGLITLGRFPHGVDAVTADIATALGRATFLTELAEDALAVKYHKLIGDLGKAVEVVSGATARRGPLGDLVRSEGETVLHAAGVTIRSGNEERWKLVRPRPIDGQERAGSSSMQSILRGQDTIETDYLNGEIVLQARLCGRAAPANALVQRWAWDVVRGYRAAGALPADRALDQIRQASSTASRRRCAAST